MICTHTIIVYIVETKQTFFRVGQTEETTFITFISRDTIEEKVYDAIIISIH